MPTLTLKDLLEAGAHFGHQTRRWNPKMKRFILCPRNGIYIIDLNKTLENIRLLTDQITTKVKAGGKVLFVGTKKQLKDCVREEAVRCGMPYVTERWLGGMLTNFQTIRQSVRKLEKIEQMEKDGTMEALPKKEVLTLGKKHEKLSTILTGIREMRKLPAIVFVVDSIKEHIAIAEAQRLKIPIGAIVDTNSDPEGIDFPIPGNDDAIKSVQTITKAIADAVLDAKTAVVPEELEKTEEGEPRPLAAAVEVGDEIAEEEVIPEEDAAAQPVEAKHHRVVRKKMVKVAEDE